jgi:hypothetical protein
MRVNDGAQIVPSVVWGMYGDQISAADGWYFDAIAVCDTQPCLLAREGLFVRGSGARQWATVSSGCGQEPVTVGGHRDGQ